MTTQRTQASTLEPVGLTRAGTTAARAPKARAANDEPNGAAVTPILTHARGQKRINLAAAVAQRAVQAEQALDLTFAELCRSYLAAHYDGADMQLRKWIDLLGERSAWDITTAEIAEPLRAMIDNGYAKATVNRNASQIGSVYKWAVKVRAIGPKGFRSPTLDLPRWDEPIRVVELTDLQLRRLVRATLTIKDRRFSVLVRLLAETGARRGEIVERTWADFDLDAGVVTVLATKTGKPRQLFFSQATAQLMARVWPKRAPAEMPFESRRAVGAPINFKKHWQKITAEVGLPNFRMHDLRHHRAKQMIQAGAAISVAAQALGHSSLVLHRRYGHLESSALQTVVRNSWGIEL